MRPRRGGNLITAVELPLGVGTDLADKRFCRQLSGRLAAAASVKLGEPCPCGWLLTVSRVRHARPRISDR